MESRVFPKKDILSMAFVLLVSLFVALGLGAGAAFADAKDDLADAQKAAEEASAGAAAAEADAASAEDAVETSAAAYDQAMSQIADIEGRIQEKQAEITQLQARIADLQSQIPGQRQAADKALVSMYKMQQEGCSLLDMLLGAENIVDFFSRIDAINRIQNANTEKLNSLLALQADLEQSQASLEADQAELASEQAQAEEERQAAQSALTEAQNQRAAAQAQAEAQRQAEADAIAAAAAAEEAIAMAEVPADANTGSNAADGDSDSTINKVVSSDQANWNTDKATFVAEWGARINAYLGSSPLGGYGEVFAEAAWEYGVDPRWSPAISLVESSKGLYCFLPHNAWGWGSSSWDSWEEAIFDHVRGLSRGYGYTISIANAQKYCPPNWQHWYNTCVSQMEMI